MLWMFNKILKKESTEPGLKWQLWPGPIHFEWTAVHGPHPVFYCLHTASSDISKMRDNFSFYVPWAMDCNLVENITWKGTIYLLISPWPRLNKEFCWQHGNELRPPFSLYSVALKFFPALPFLFSHHSSFAPLFLQIIILPSEETPWLHVFHGDPEWEGGQRATMLALPFLLERQRALLSLHTRMTTLEHYWQ